ncbi:hypothetical protein KCP76_09005 [Salmonella enterica subsp. enterica serovar Weltevreden]|nr:hypothetical protein KCP76_09005 [Salmonella enterica subsp. enterica serovar Weltevreden]
MISNEVMKTLLYTFRQDEIKSYRLSEKNPVTITDDRNVMMKNHVKTSGPACWSAVSAALTLAVTFRFALRA